MNIEELYREMSTRDSRLSHLQEAENEDYEVVVEGCDDGLVGGPSSLIDLLWDHEGERLVLMIG